MSGAIPLLPLYAFSAWTGKTNTFLPLPHTVQQKNAGYAAKASSMNPYIYNSIANYCVFSCSVKQIKNKKHTQFF
jgi:hypothetical protein